MAEANAASTPDVVLCLNAGSSSLKFALFRVDGATETELAAGTSTDDAASALQAALESLREQGLPAPTMIGHRVVHGGAQHVRPARVDAALLADLRALVPLAPLHQPAAIRGIELAAQQFPGLPQVACFDTAFHANLPEVTQRFSLPRSLYDAGVRHYGFHGLSYEYVMSTLGAAPPARVIIAHLGNGSSLAAVANGQCVDTTMGFTPGSGIMMGSRLGDVDPGVLLYLLREKGYSVDALERLVDRESGLFGIAGSSDVKTLTLRAPFDAQARLALEMFGYSVRKAIGAYIAVLGGIDLLVFTGGIGEHSALVRGAACAGMAALGIELDPERNERGDAEIQHAASPCAVHVLATDEDRVVARHARRTLRG